VFTEGEFTTGRSEPAAPRSPARLLGAVALGLLAVLGLTRLSSSPAEVADPVPAPTATSAPEPTSIPVATTLPGPVPTRAPLVTSLDGQASADVCPDGSEWKEAIASEAADEAIKTTEVFGGAVAVTVLSGPICDRIEISIWGPTNGQPARVDAEHGIIRLASGPALSRVFGEVPDTAPAILTWTDMASGEANVIAVAQGPDGPEVAISFGAGDVQIRQPRSEAPSLHVIDIAQNQTPTGLLFGPITDDYNAPRGSSLALLQPLQIDLTGPGRPSDIEVLGITVDPENTVIQLTPWDESLPFNPASMSDAYPVNVRGLGGENSVLKGAREFSPSHEVFEVELLGVSQGAWVLTMTLNPGAPDEWVVGQRFRVISDPGGPGTSADPIPVLPTPTPSMTCELPPTSAFNSSSVTTNLWTTPECDRVLIILPRNLSTLPTITQDERLGTIDINLGDVPGSPERVVWEDAATANMNLLVLDDQPDGLHAHLSYGAGTATVRQLVDPDRIEIIIEQEPWPPGMIAGPIMIRDSAPLVVLSTPLQPDISGPGVTTDVVFRGYAADPANTLIEVRQWDESPVTRNSPEPFDRTSAGAVLAVPVRGLTPDGEAVVTGGAFAPTQQLFELELVDLPPASWIVTVTANPDTEQEEVVGQYFRKSGSSSSLGPLAQPIASLRGG